MTDRLFSAIAATVVMAGLAPAVSAEEIVIPFSQLTPSPVLNLSGQHPQWDIPVPIAQRWQVDDAQLTLNWINSDRVEAGQSQLVVQVNGLVAGQSALSPKAPRGSLTVSLDPAGLSAGYHNVSLQASLFGSDPAYGVTSAQWAQVLPAQSQLTLQYKPRPVPANLPAALSFLFDPKQRVDQRVHLVIEQLDLDNLRAASLAAAAVTLRFDYLPVQFSVGDSLDPAVDNVVLGSRAFVQKRTGASLPDGSSVLAVSEVPASTNHRGAVMVVGETPDALMLAIQGLSGLRILPDMPAVALDGVSLPAREALSQPLMVRPRERIAFSALRDGSLELTPRTPVQEIMFRLPADIDTSGGLDARMVLSMAYTPGMRADSTVNIILNGTFVGGVPLSNRDGGRYRDYGVDIPLRLFQGGMNTLRFQAELAGDANAPGQSLTSPLQVALYPDSALELSDYHLSMSMPNLKAFGQSGFPFSHLPDGQDSAVVLPGVLDLPTAVATVNLISRLTARIGVFPQHLLFSTDSSGVGQRNLLVVSPAPALPPPLARAVGLDGPISTLSFLEASAQRNLEGAIDSFLLQLVDGAPQYVNYDYLGHTTLSALPDFAAEHLVVAGGPSPYAPGRSVVAVVARSQADMLVLAKLSQNKIWDGLDGGMTLIRTEAQPPVFESVLLNNRYQVGSSGATRNYVTALIYAYPTRFLLATLVGLVLLGWLLTRWHVRYRRNHTRPQA